MHSNSYVHSVAALSKKNITYHANLLRSKLNIETEIFPIQLVLEVIFPKIFPTYIFHVAEKDYMSQSYGKTVEAMTTPNNMLIEVREDIYEKLQNNDPRARFTLAHEIGHLVLHQNPIFARSSTQESTPTYCNSEWQANTFAAELLAPIELVKTCSSSQAVQEKFLLSRSAAENRFKDSKKTVNCFTQKT